MVIGQKVFEFEYKVNINFKCKSSYKFYVLGTKLTIKNIEKKLSDNNECEI
jgi:hypothetical protein